MSDRVCVRECTQRDVHWATCVNNDTIELLRRAKAEDNGETYIAPCKGCAPRECRDGSLICDQCFGKARALLSDAPELRERLRSEGDARKSKWNWDSGPVVSSTSVHPNGPINDDLLDSIHAVEYGMWFFAAGIETLSNDAAAMSQLGPLLLDFHKPDEDGVRESWSVLDALKRWGLERRESYRHVFPGKLPNAPLGSYAKFDEEEEATPIAEYFDRPVDVKQAAELAGVGVRTVQMWAKRGLIVPVMKVLAADGNVHTYFRTSDIDARTTNPREWGSVGSERIVGQVKRFPNHMDGSAT